MIDEKEFAADNNEHYRAKRMQSKHGTGGLEMATEKRLIDAKDAVKLLRGKCVAKYPSTFLMGLLASATEIEQIPTVDAVEVVHGRWIDRYGGKYAIPAYDCSECKKSAPLMHDMDMLGNWKARQFFANYCPNCGAKMDGDGNG